jgi:hypothetical protein
MTAVRGQRGAAVGHQPEGAGFLGCLEQRQQYVNLAHAVPGVASLAHGLLRLGQLAIRYCARTKREESATHKKERQRHQKWTSV